MKELSRIREEIDGIDSQIAALYEARMQLTAEVAEYKLSVGKPVLDKAREKEKLEKVKGLVQAEENRYGVGELFEQIMALSRRRQYQMMIQHGQGNDMGFAQVDSLPFSTHKVVYQGTEGAYSQIAMKAYFGEAIDSYHVETWRDAMEAISRQADYAVLPIENSSAGIVGENFDLLVEYDNCIVAEQTIKVEHALLGLPGSSISDITHVYSHPQALMQSVDFLNMHKDWKQKKIENTAMAAKKIVEDGQKCQAAIASTRFIIISGKKICLQEAKKVSICFEISHESGSLYHMLSHFIFNNLNMVKIESRPIKDKSFEYRFFVDMEGNLGDGAVQNALKGLQEGALYLKVLGNY